MKSLSLLFSTMLTVAGTASAVTFCMVSIATTAHAQPHSAPQDFITADLDHDNQLDLTEAEHAFPLVTFTDPNNDGLISTREAEKVVPGLLFERDTHEDDGTIVGPEQFQLLAEKYALIDQDLRKGTLKTPFENKDGEVKNDAPTDN